ncbi:hypothetical protein J2741_001107 [Methanolinea mesophila]|uniref:hypothetical protein n=1 Tax=Methanolinea mesophila TaxID=547055 RepID=UPI001AE0F106|nr:hypothetical protein [Methanolinea mesophila]MBP1928560.1 hypothetical protein [Methanolinea mesophila]
MDAIEKGFDALVTKVQEYEKKKEQLKGAVVQKEALLLARMGEETAPVISGIGLVMLERGKTDNCGELYDTQFYKEKMIVLGKTDPAEYRPDDISKKVTDQFCVLSEEGKFYELMYSSDGFIVDSFRNPIDPREALEIYGYEIMFMLYRAMRDYLAEEKELVEALQKTIDFLHPEEMEK